ncbi:hypothetical protein R3P38DRAFT_3276473 [Favolaschia claudopus]|uniref:K Homology domain-containing protein n=1 Tax=Favolaschia claudopus TaxID=2862362 RepID=A0AAW0ASC1_9AGAR
MPSPGVFSLGCLRVHPVAPRPGVQPARFPGVFSSPTPNYGCISINKPSTRVFSYYSCTLVVPDSVVGHIVGRGGKGLHQSHDTLRAQLRAYTDKASPLERRVSIRGTDQQIGEALIALGKRFMRKRTGDPAPPPPGPVLGFAERFWRGLSPAEEARTPRPPVSASQLRFRPLQRPVLSRTQVPLHRQGSLGCDLHHRSLPTPPSHSLPHNPATISIPTQVMASPIPTPRPSSTPYAPSVAMSTAVPSPSPRSVAPSPMAIDAIRPERGRRPQTARRGGAVSASDSRIDPRAT